MRNYFTVLFCLLFCVKIHAQSRLISAADLAFLKQMTKDVMDSARIRPLQEVPVPFGKNNTGGTLIRPGGRDTYPSFWIRDYAMSLATGFVTAAEQKHMLRFTAAGQCDKPWTTRGGSSVPIGAIPDHIRVDDSRPIYFPGTYDYEGQGVKEFGMTPPYDDQYYFIAMASHYVSTTGDVAILKQEINGRTLAERLELAFQVPPADDKTGIVYTDDATRGVDFGFRDAVEITGQLCYTSLLKYDAARQMEKLWKFQKNEARAGYYAKLAAQLKAAIPALFVTENGMLRASTGKSGQEDVWATALAIELGVLNGAAAKKAALKFADAFEAGTLSYKGSIRHVLTDADFNEKTAWEQSIAAKNTYQNGAYWGTPVGWVARAIVLVKPDLARRLVGQYVAELRENDFRKGGQFASPLECFNSGGYTRGPVYLTTVTCPLIALSKP